MRTTEPYLEAELWVINSCEERLKVIKCASNINKTTYTHVQRPSNWTNSKNAFLNVFILVSTFFI